MKVRDSSFRTITRQRTLPEPTDLTEPISRAALELARPEVRGIRVRLLGVTASGLGEREQLPVRAGRPAAPPAVEAADALRRRYGERAVTRARLLGAGLPAPFERDPRNPLDRRARGVPADAVPGSRKSGQARSVTAKVTQERTKFRSMTLDIEQAFGLVSGSNRTNVLSDECPERHDQRPRKGDPAWHSSESTPSRFTSGPIGSAAGHGRSPGARNGSLSSDSQAVRQEAAAYPVITGPRTLFEVDTPRARLSLTFQHRSRRWTVTGLTRLSVPLP